MVCLPALNQFPREPPEPRLLPLQSKKTGSFQPVTFQLHVECSEPIKARPISLQTRHPRVLPPCSLCGWGLTTALRVGWSSCARSSSDVLRLLSPHEGWKLPLFSLWSPVPNQYGSPGWTTEGLEATWRGDMEDEMPAWTWRTATKRDHPAEFQPTHRIMRSNVAGTEIYISRLTFQGKE